MPKKCAMLFSLYPCPFEHRNRKHLLPANASFHVSRRAAVCVFKKSFFTLQRRLKARYKKSARKRQGICDEALDEG